MEDIKIRPASEADAKLIARVVAMAMGEECATLLCGADYMNILEQIALAEGTQYSYTNALIALVNGEPAGAVVGYDGALLEPLRSATVSVIKKSFSEYSLPDDETQAGEFYIDSLGVLPKFRGYGVGKRLLMAMTGKGLALGCSKVGLIVDVENPGASSLYCACGFEEVGEKLFFGHKMRHMQCSHLFAEERILYTGLNYPQIQEFCGDKILAPYICMGFSMLSLIVPDGFLTVNEGDTICRDGLGNYWVE
jgi:ribosomal protein S18 acetylase RimI-like enzyme